jgi:hypothetical protein
MALSEHGLATMIASYLNDRDDIASAVVDGSDVALVTQGGVVYRVTVSQGPR